MCGIVGVCMKGMRGRDDASAASAATLVLRRLQHRGHEGAGIAVCHGASVRLHRGSGLVATVLTSSVYEQLVGSMAIAQTRYGTSGGKQVPDPLRDLGPLYAETAVGPMAIAHNGTIHGAEAMRRQLIESGATLLTGTDTEVLQRLVARAPGKDVLERLVHALPDVPPAYALAVLSPDGLHAIRDSMGIRPLALGEGADCYVVASETSVFPLLGCTYVRDVEPGEILTMTPAGTHSTRFAASRTHRPCLFEYVYFARPDHEGGAVQLSRKLAGHVLAKHHAAPPGVVVGVPDSGLVSAHGYAEVTGDTFSLAIVRDHAEGRAFMRPTSQERQMSLRLKHSISGRLVDGESVTLIDDSLVRGHTLRRIVGLLRAAGARAVHIRIACPMVVHPCYWGIDTPTHEELFATRHATDVAMADALGADSVEFLTLDELQSCAHAATGKTSFCTTCFDGALVR